MAKSKLSQLTPDKKNANKGTERGRYMVEKSLQELGAGRSILVDSKGNIIAGNKTAEAAASIGLDDIITIETDGTQLVVVKRTDLDLDDPTGKARQLAYADNRTSEVSYELDPLFLADDLALGLDITDFYLDYEIEDILEKAIVANVIDEGEAFGKVTSEDRQPFQQITFTLHDDQIQSVKDALSVARRMDTDKKDNENGNGNALALICEMFLGEYGNS